jgi:hypothetical protein
MIYDAENDEIDDAYDAEVRFAAADADDPNTVALQNLPDTDDTTTKPEASASEKRAIIRAHEKSQYKSLA